MSVKLLRQISLLFILYTGFEYIGLTQVEAQDGPPAISSTKSQTLNRREETIMAPSGQYPFLLVTESAGGTGNLSTREPGLYTIGQNQTWEIAVPGKILASMMDRGILGHLYIHGADTRFPAVAIGDGIITVFTSNSRARKSESVLLLGTKSLPLVDPLTGENILLPPIKNLDAVSIYQSPKLVHESPSSSKFLQTVFFSMKLPGDGPLAKKGITFAVTIRSGRYNQSALSVAGVPTVLDYGFRTAQELRVLDSGSANTPYNLLSLRNISLPMKGDPEEVLLFRKKVVTQLERLEKGQGPTFADTPTYSIPEQSVKLPSRIEKVYIGKGSSVRGLVQVFKLSGDGVITKMDRQTILFPTLADIRGKTGFHIYPVEHSSYIVYVQKKPYWVTDAGDVLPMPRELSDAYPKDPSKISVRVLDGGSTPAGHQRSLIFISRILEKNILETGFFSVETNGGKSVIGGSAVLGKFFATVDEIMDRYSHKLAQFDNVTNIVPAAGKKITNKLPYSEAMVPTTARVDLYKTLEKKNGLVQVYNEYLSTFALTNSMSYVVANQLGAAENSSGFLFSRNDKPAELIRGELLLSANAKASEVRSEQPYLAKVSGLMRQGDLEPAAASPAELFVSAYDPVFAGGTNGFKLLVSGKVGQRSFYKTIASPNFPFKEMKDLTVIQGLGNRSNYFYIFFTRKSQKQSQLSYGTFTLDSARATVGKPGLEEFTINNATVGATNSETITFETLTDPVTMGELLRSRLIFDEQGTLYIIFQSDAASDTVKRVKNVVTGAQMAYSHIELSGGKLTAAADLEAIKEFANRFRYSSWRVKFQHAADSIAKDLGEENLNKMKIPNQENHFEDEIFQGLPELLEQFASPNTPREKKLMLVSGEDSELLQKRIIKHLFDDPNYPKRGFSVASSVFEFFYLNNKKLSQGSLMEELMEVRERAAEAGKKVLLVAPLKNLLENIRPTALEGRSQFSIPYGNGKGGAFVPSILYLLAAGGEQIDPGELKKRLDRMENSSSTDFSAVLIGTKEEWAQIVSALEPVEKSAGIARIFKKDTRFFNNSWKMWVNHGFRTHKSLKEINSKKPSNFEEKLFPSVFADLETLSDPALPPKRQILVVPKELKERILRIAYFSWMSGSGRKHWSHLNPNLLPSRFDATSFTRKDRWQVETIVGLSQEQMIENLRALSDTAVGARGLLIGSMDKVLGAGRVKRVNADRVNSKASFMLNIQKADGDGAVESAAIDPHALYLVASEGRPLQLNEFEVDEKKPTYSTLIIATEEELAKAKEEVGFFEGKYGLWESFEIQELGTPGREAREEILSDTFGKTFPQFQFDFSAKGVVNGAERLSAEESRLAVVKFLVSRTENLASSVRGQPMEATYAFTQFLTTVVSTILQDPDFKKTGRMDAETGKTHFLIDKSFGDVFVYPKVFGQIALDVAQLPADDLLSVLSDKRAALRFQESGYEGPPDLRKKIIGTLLNQTHSGGKAIPSSMIVYGDSSTGKSYMFEVLIKLLKLKLYDFNGGGENNEAQALIINAGTILDGETKKDEDPKDKKFESSKEAATQTLTFDEIQRGLDDFLSRPKGYRGYILFDDLHKTSQANRTKLITMINSLFEAREGFFLTKRGPIPVRNLTLLMTLNPIEDQQQLSKFKPKDLSLGERLIANILAAIGGDIERSFIERWGSSPLDLTLFPVSAKAPKLASSLLPPAKDAFTNHGKFVLFPPSVFDIIASEFGTVNARAFENAASPALMHVANSWKSQFSNPLDNGQGQALIVIAKPSAVRSYRKETGARGTERGIGEDGRAIGGSRGIFSQEEIRTFIENEMIPLSINNDIDGKLEFIKLLVSSFRSQIFFQFIKQIQEDPHFNATEDLRVSIQPQLLRAVVNHLVENPELNAAEIEITPKLLGVHSSSRAQAMIDLANGTAERYFPFDFIKPFTRDRFEAHFSGDTLDTRRDVVAGKADRLNEYFKSLLLAELQVTDENMATADTRRWLQNLSGGFNRPLYGADLGRYLVTELLDLNRSLSHRGLVENLASDKYPAMTLYDEYRVFLYSIDRAIAKLPWSQSAGFLLNAINTAGSELSIAQTPNVLQYFFTDKKGLMRGPNLETLISYATSSDTYMNSLIKDIIVRDEKLFSGNCKELFDGYPNQP